MSEITAPEASFQFINYRIDKSVLIRKADGKVKPLSINFNPKGKFYKATNKFELYLGVVIKDENENLKIEIEAVGFFMLTQEGTEEAKRNFFYINAPAILFPYIRAYIATLTTLSGYLLPITLPTMNISGLGTVLEKNTEIIESSN